MKLLSYIIVFLVISVVLIELSDCKKHKKKGKSKTGKRSKSKSRSATKSKSHNKATRKSSSPLGLTSLVTKKRRKSKSKSSSLIPKLPVEPDLPSSVTELPVEPNVVSKLPSVEPSVVPKLPSVAPEVTNVLPPRVPGGLNALPPTVPGIVNVLPPRLPVLPGVVPSVLAEESDEESESPESTTIVIHKLPPRVSIPDPISIALSAPAAIGNQLILNSMKAWKDNIFKLDLPFLSAFVSADRKSGKSSTRREPSQDGSSKTNQSFPMVLIQKLPRAMRLLFPNAGLGWIKKTSKNFNPGVIWDGSCSSDAIHKNETPILVKKPDTIKAPFYMHFAGAAYCKLSDLKKWKCPLCSNEGNYKFVKGTDIKSRSKIYILQNDDEEEFVVAVRGAYNIKTILSNTFKKFVSPEIGPANILVHRGFNAEAKKFMPFIKENLQPLASFFPDHKIVLTGHGSGAAIAELLYFYSIEEKLFPNKTFEIFTYGSPRVGNIKWADYMNSQRIRIARVVNGADLMAHVPFSGLPYSSSLKVGPGDAELDYFYHHATEVWIIPNTQVPVTCLNEFYEDPDCSASVATIYNPNDHLKYFDVDVLKCADPIEEIVKSTSPIDLPMPKMEDFYANVKNIPVVGSLYNTFNGIGRKFGKKVVSTLFGLPNILSKTDAFKKVLTAFKNSPLSSGKSIKDPPNNETETSNS